MIWPFNRKPQEPPAPPAPPAPRFIGGECHLVVGDQVVALYDKEVWGGRILKGVIYTVAEVRPMRLLDALECRGIGLILSEIETHWYFRGETLGGWMHVNFRKAASVRDFEAFRTQLLAPVDLNERAKV